MHGGNLADAKPHSDSDSDGPDGKIVFDIPMDNWSPDDKLGQAAPKTTPKSVMIEGGDADAAPSAAKDTTQAGGFDVPLEPPSQPPSGGFAVPLAAPDVQGAGSAASSGTAPGGPALPGANVGEAVSLAADTDKDAEIAHLKAELVRVQAEAAAARELASTDLLDTAAQLAQARDKLGILKLETDMKDKQVDRLAVRCSTVEGELAVEKQTVFRLTRERDAIEVELKEARKNAEAAVVSAAATGTGELVESAGLAVARKEVGA